MITTKDLVKTVRKEGNFEKDMVKKIKELFPSCYEIPKPIMPSSKGTPDRLFVIRGKFVALETKRSKDYKVAKIQEKRLEEIRLAGGYGGIVKNWDEVVDVLTRAGLTNSPCFYTDDM